MTAIMSPAYRRVKRRENSSARTVKLVMIGAMGIVLGGILGSWAKDASQPIFHNNTAAIAIDSSKRLRPEPTISSSFRNNADNEVATTSSKRLYQKHASNHNNSNLGVVVFLAPQRNHITWWHDIPRFCLLRRSIRSVDQHLNSHYGPYKIIVLVARDYSMDPKKLDGPYTDQDRNLIRSWAPNSEVEFVEINMYSQDALEPNTNVEQIIQWRQGKDGAIEGRDVGYQSMCRLWSGRLQMMDILKPYEYYLRMDDDSLLTSALPFDPFVRMKEEHLDYAFRRRALDKWGIKKLEEIIQRHIEVTNETPFMHEGGYYGEQPYNNFHVSRTSFWSESRWVEFWDDLNKEHAFFKYRLGDANVHAAAVMMLQPNQWEEWHTFPYVHNTNDMPNWAPLAWKTECDRVEPKF